LSQITSALSPKQYLKVRATITTQNIGLLNIKIVKKDAAKNKNDEYSDYELKSGRNAKLRACLRDSVKIYRRKR
jgi:hypothetical protein